MIDFDFSADYILENDFVQLRPLVKDDFVLLQHFAAVAPIWKYSSIRVQNADDFKNYIHLALQGKAKQDEYPFTVFDKRQGKFAGSTRFYDIRLAHKALQLGYTWYGPEFHGTGLNKHCKFLLLQFAFGQMGMERVEFRADNRNEKSIAAMKSIGCTVEGILRRHSIQPDGSRRDTIVLSILRDEWEGNVKQNLLNRL